MIFSGRSSNANQMQQIRREAGDGPAAAAATSERYRRYGFFIFLCREIAQAVMSDGKGSQFHSGLRKLSHFKLDCLYSLLC